MGIIESILSPLSLSLVIAAAVAGLLFGRFYNTRLGLPEAVIYHKLITGWGFVGFMFIFRVVEILLFHSMINAWGWLGIGILWTIFCVFIWISSGQLYKKIKR